MFDLQNRAGAIISGVLVFILLAGVTALCIRLIGHSPREIALTNIEPPNYTYVVSVEGAVVNPGSYPAATTDSLISIINSAGLKKTADTKVISVHISDLDKTAEPQKVNINTAPVWMLDALPGIGAGRAENIVAYRNKNGPFKGIDELLNVDGIGQSAFEKIKDLVTVGD
jgi:competence protein ComEA